MEDLFFAVLGHPATRLFAIVALRNGSRIGKKNRDTRWMCNRLRIPRELVGIQEAQFLLLFTKAVSQRLHIKRLYIVPGCYRSSADGWNITKDKAIAIIAHVQQKGIGCQDLQAYRLSDGSAANHGACKPCSELRHLRNCEVPMLKVDDMPMFGYEITCFSACGPNGNPSYWKWSDICDARRF